MITTVLKMVKKNVRNMKVCGQSSYKYKSEIP